MKRFNLDPAALTAEMVALNRTLLKGMTTLQGLGPIEVGSTPRTQIYAEDKLRLFHYPARSGTPSHAPLLIVYALVNRPYILDLQPDRSLIRGLTEHGIPVYLIDWGYPDQTDRHLDLDDYLNNYLDHCVDQTLSHAGKDTLNLLGVCQGGTFSLCYSALNPNKVRNLVTLVTPVDFRTDDNLLGQLTRELDLSLALDTYGNVPGFLLAQFYNSLMPARLGIQKKLEMPMQLADQEKAGNFLRMEQWIQDSPDLAGEACREFVEQFYRRNALITGGLKIGNRAVDPAAFKGPVLNLYAARDHLVPPSASIALEAITGSRDYSAHELPGGHIGVFAGRQAQARLPALIGRWLKARQ
ncbi:class III poly(R)-hydroxyalkanoic acid synthase subunit PhaC [Motiliproteus sp. SC1-56]|uniref:class III poly(R)-hydroxyalkanoic acid synthase subunit PhaC n=1 Tax=Motiliproteus sp. SC1-56 TaxID=2799565 RepID=UPI001A905BAB|nr:class III poly(R)-hydroxyalkanoic acid synthase subunit PhaC [Motiliproteus sp. SC1-56]